ncbi:hypothetical protein Tco_1545920 [Tanacetum coccineum]
MVRIRWLEKYHPAGAQQWNLLEQPNEKKWISRLKRKRAYDRDDGAGPARYSLAPVTHAAHSQLTRQVPRPSMSEYNRKMSDPAAKGTVGRCQAEASLRGLMPAPCRGENGTACQCEEQERADAAK